MYNDRVLRRISIFETTIFKYKQPATMRIQKVKVKNYRTKITLTIIWGLYSRGVGQKVFNN
jgi:hypothetical protein